MAATTEIPGVNSAVQKLQELEDRMKTEEFGFKDNDVDNIDKIVDALYELERERKNIHDELEKETIRSSILRYQLRILPGQIRDEIMEAVMSARNSNAKVLHGLQNDLNTMNSTMDSLNKQSRDYEQENAVLQPERELLKQQHEEIISQLNQRMAEKASMQIALNETRDKVRQANQDIVDLEDGILQLKEDLIQERTDARHEKKRLRRAVTDTTQKTKEQKDQNVTKRKELDTFQEKLADSEGKLHTVRKAIRRYETSRAKLEGGERALASELAKQLTMNDQMRLQGADIMNKRIEEERKFKEAQEELLNKIKKFEEEMTKEAARKVEMDKKKLQLGKEYEVLDERRTEDKGEVESLDAVLQASKDQLNVKAEELGAMQKENIEMTETIEELAESHKAVLAQLNKQIEEYKEQLSKERKDRLEVQAQKEDIAKQLDDLRSEGQAFMNEMTSKVQDGKKRHMELSNEGMRLQKELKTDEALVQDLEKQLKDVQNSYEAMFSDFQKRQDIMESEVLRLEADLSAKMKELEEKTPIFQDLEKHFATRSEEYDAVKKHTVALKNQKTSLDDQIKRTQKEMDMIKAPQGQLHEDIKQKRGMFMNQLKSTGDSTKSKEGEILEAGCKLRRIMEENEKFEENIKKVQADLDDILKQIEENEHIKERLALELQMQKDELVKKWQTDSIMQDFFASRDKATAEAFTRLLDRTNKREAKINMVTDRLTEELGVLGDFLNSLSSRRPPRTRSKQQSRGDAKDHKSRGGSRSRSRSKSNERGESEHRPHPPESPRPQTTYISRASTFCEKSPVLLPKIDSK